MCFPRHVQQFAAPKFKETRFLRATPATSTHPFGDVRTWFCESFEHQTCLQNIAIAHRCFWTQFFHRLTLIFHSVSDCYVKCCKDFMCARHVTHNQLLASNAVPFEGLAVRVNSCNKQDIHQNVTPVNVLEMSYPKTFNLVSKSMPVVFEIECRGQRASADIPRVPPCLERLKRSSVRWLRMECHVAFWTLIVILIQSKRTPTHSGSRRPSSGKFW